MRDHRSQSIHDKLSDSSRHSRNPTEATAMISLVYLECLTSWAWNSWLWRNLVVYRKKMVTTLIWSNQNTFSLQNPRRRQKQMLNNNNHSNFWIYSQNTHTSLQNNIHVSKEHCRSAFEPDAFGLPHYCTPRVCIPDVIGALAVWRHSITKKLRAPEDRLSSGVLKEEFGRMIYEKKSSLGNRGRSGVVQKRVMISLLLQLSLTLAWACVKVLSKTLPKRDNVVHWKTNRKIINDLQ